MPTEQQIADAKGAEIAGNLFRFTNKASTFEEFITIYLLPSLINAKETNSVKSLLLTLKKNINNKVTNKYSFEFDLDQYLIATGLDDLDLNDNYLAEKVILNLQIYVGAITSELINNLNRLAFIQNGDINSYNIISKLLDNLGTYATAQQKRLILAQSESKIIELDKRIQDNVSSAIKQIRSTLEIV